MEYKDLTKRYFDGELSPAEEQTLHDELAAVADNALTNDERAAKAMLHYASLKSNASVSVKLHESRTHGRTRLTDAIVALCSMRYARIATTAVLGVVAIAMAIHLSQPTVYGYHNGKPITSYDEAQLLAQDIFDNLAHDGFAENHDLQKLFTLD
ncbi:MAG: hypothetical protein IKY82_05980 [Alistipes sp.]|nr:hypothetical protein [Alistipes sp.]